MFTMKLFFSVQTFSTFTITCQFYFVLKINKLHLLYTSAAITLVHFRLDFIMEANTMNPDQTAPFWVHIVCHIGYLRT